MVDTMNPADAATTHPLRTLVRVAGRVGRGIRWYMTTLMGDTAYATYVAHHRRAHPGEEPMTERQFWRQKMDDQDRNPGARCC
ncbi:hypothetical protein GCM10010458_19610 [Microbacterium luteolum]|uniref:YbdD/YjiX family protein n=1 Tax=Microbacterium luteolum TaxID=69367 RepID=A0ABY7XR98_MICLT|nr:YbdD/YjiX family protein [Microbacterium luteolum]WDM44639.1 YbdD/YjiX family protein [Microbacterium luteolum]